MVDLSIVQTMVLWAIVPGFVTTSILRLLGYRSEQQRDPRYQARYRLVFTAVVVSYLAYTVDASLPPSPYTILELRPDTFTTKDLRVNYRRLSLLYHPDKAKSDKAENASTPFNHFPASEAAYLEIRNAYDILKDPVLKEAYDRLGPSLGDCRTCKTERDFVLHGLAALSGFYVGTGGLLAILSATSGSGGGGGSSDPLRWWRFLLLFAAACVEARGLVAGAAAPPLDDGEGGAARWWGVAGLGGWLWAQTPWAARTPGESAALLRQLFFAASAALSQLGPVWASAAAAAAGGPGGQRQRMSAAVLAGEAVGLAAACVQEARAGLRDAWAPLSRDAAGVAEVRRRVRDAVVDVGVAELEPRIAAASAAIPPASATLAPSHHEGGAASSGAGGH
ncbi:hypothetical protein HK405_005070 [Cladochytrium tenue]|nr:hypothetical protein HK405_005070 [Cladochytrium tenue]